jgi:hypothetical protein|tara:strand:- start:235 stop:624 length:390 start_codon:yes stop_codon:yes gene_type:complete
VKKYILLCFVISLTYNYTYSQNSRKKELSISILQISGDTLKIIPNGSAHFISKIKTEYINDTLKIKVFRANYLSQFLFGSIKNIFYSEKRKRNMKGVYVLEKPVLYYETFEGVWVKQLINGEILLTKSF